MIRPCRDHAADEVRAAIDRRKGIRKPQETRDPKAAKARRRIEDMQEAKRLREATEWL